MAADRTGVLWRPRAPLEEVLTTEELARRPSRPPDYAAENRALLALAQAMAESPADDPAEACGYGLGTVPSRLHGDQHS